LRQWILSINPDPNADTDADGIPDIQDAFADDPSESVDTDGDGIGDNADAEPNNASNDGNITSIQSSGSSGGGSWSWWLCLSMFSLLVARHICVAKPYRF